MRTPSPCSPRLGLLSATIALAALGGVGCTSPIAAEDAVDARATVVVAGTGIAAFTTAEIAAGGNGAVIVVPAGRYEFNRGSWLPTVIRRDMHVLCEPGAIIARNGSSGDPLFDFNEMENVTVEGCTFEFSYVDPSIGAPPAHQQAISFEGGNGLVVRDNTFYLTHEPLRHYGHTGLDLTRPTEMAILARGAQNILVTGNHSTFMQFKFGGPYSGGTEMPTPGHYYVENVIVADNVFVSPYNYAVSVVTARNGEASENLIGGIYHHTRNIQLLNNRIENVASAGAFYVGAEGEFKSGAEMSNVSIRGNVVSGTFPDNLEGASSEEPMAYGFILRCSERCRNWIVAQNTIVNENVATTTASGTARGYGIIVNGQPIEQLTIANNTIGGVSQGAGDPVGGGFDRAAIGILNGGTDISVTGNVISHSDGIRVRSVNDIRRLSIHDNVVTRGRGSALALGCHEPSVPESPCYTGGGGIYSASVRNNVLEVGHIGVSGAVIVRDVGPGVPFEVVFRGNQLGTANVSDCWGGDNPPDESCMDNIYRDPSGTSTPLGCP